MNISVEIKSLQDLVMLDTIIDLWKSKWKEDEVEDEPDAEDEQCDGDDESCEGCKSADEAVAETVSFFVEHQDIWQALSGLVNAMRDAGVSGSVSFDRSDESRKTDRS